MRLLLMIALVAAGLVAVTAPAWAGCSIGGRDVACTTANGKYRIRLPRGAGPFPAVIYLYGSLGNSRTLIENEGFVQAFVERGYAVIVPAGLDIRYKTGLGSGWFLRNTLNRKKRDDTAFVAEVLNDAEIRHRIDRRRVLIAGMSNGAFLAWEIACHEPGLASAFAPIAGGYLGSMPRRCDGPVRILHTHGRADRVVTIDDSGNRLSGGVRIMLLSETLDRIATSNGCAGPARPEKFREYTRTHWQGCPHGSSVDLLLHNGGHTIPLSWFSTVIDWFEGEGRAGATGTAVGGGTPSFQRVDGGDRRPTGGRFKRPAARE